jgi:hypothetical protein
MVASDVDCVDNTELFTRLNVDIIFLVIKHIVSTHFSSPSTHLIIRVSLLETNLDAFLFVSDRLRIMIFTLVININKGKTNLRLINQAFFNPFGWTLNLVFL